MTYEELRLRQLVASCMTRHRQILNEAAQLRRDVDSYNENHLDQKPVEIDLDFTRELEADQGAE